MNLVRKAVVGNGVPGAIVAAVLAISADGMVRAAV
jgi:hypothetical protein